MEWAISRNIVSKTLKACRFTSLEDVRPENYDKRIRHLWNHEYNILGVASASLFWVSVRVAELFLKLSELFLKLSELFLKLSELFLNLQNYF